MTDSHRLPYFTFYFCGISQHMALANLPGIKRIFQQARSVVTWTFSASSYSTEASPGSRKHCSFWAYGCLCIPKCNPNNYKWLKSRSQKLHLWSAGIPQVCPCGLWKGRRKRRAFPWLTSDHKCADPQNCQGKPLSGLPATVAGTPGFWGHHSS